MFNILNAPIIVLSTYRYPSFSMTGLSSIFDRSKQSIFAEAVKAAPLSDKLRFHEMTRRLPKQELEVLNSKLGQVTDFEIKALLFALNQGDWNAAAFRSENYPYVALEAYKRGLITSEQFGTVMLYWVNCRDFGKDQIEAIPLFNENGTVNERAEKIIQSTMWATGLSPIPNLPAIPQTHSYLDSENLRQTILELKKLPTSERFIFIRQKDYAQGNIADVIKGSGINIFHTFEGGCMIPSIGLVRSFTKTKFGAQAAKINLVLGLSSSEDIEKNNRTGSRDVALHFPGTTLPTTADNQNAPGYLFTLHDLLYHLFMVSQVPFDHAHRYMAVVEQVKDYIVTKKNKGIDTQLAEQYKELLIDMDFGEYRQEILTLKGYRLPHEQRLEYVFWSILATYIGHAQQFLKESALEVEPSLDVPLVETPAEIDLLNLVATHLPRDIDYHKEMKAEIGFIQRFNPNMDVTKTHLFYLYEKWMSLSKMDQLD